MCVGGVSHLDRFQEELIRGAVEDRPTLGARFELMTEAMAASVMSSGSRE